MFTCVKALASVTVLSSMPAPAPSVNWNEKLDTRWLCNSTWVASGSLSSPVASLSIGFTSATVPPTKSAPVDSPTILKHV